MDLHQPTSYIQAESEATLRGSRNPEVLLEDLLSVRFWHARPLVLHLEQHRV
ncbi:hypothetical protein LCGC14_1666440, partial [marine sediment metagenome]